MADATTRDTGAPTVFTIAVYRAFSDSLVNGVLALHGGDRLALARGTILVPNKRAARSVTDAFVRTAENGLLLPRIVAIGDAGEIPGLAFDGVDSDVAPAVDPLQRRLILARLLQEEQAVAGRRIGTAEALRLATELASALDELIAEDRSARELRTLDIAQELAVHWQKSLDLFATVIERWPEESARLGQIDLPERRNRLLRGLAEKWRADPPPHFVIAAGVTSSAPAIAEVLGVVARLTNGAVILPGVDLVSSDDEWQAISGSGGRAIESHPQYHLWRVLDAIGVSRGEVRLWRWGDGRPSRSVRRRVVSNAFAPARFTSKWIELKPHLLRLSGVRLAEFASPADEAQGIAIALRRVLETPARTAALVTPDRALAQRVTAHLNRWQIDADDSAGRPLALTPVGVLVQSLAVLGTSSFAPNALLAVLKHPLVRQGDLRLDWLDGVRRLDSALRGPRPAPGLDGLAGWLSGGNDRERPARQRAQEWWSAQASLLEPLEQAFASPLPTLGTLLASMSETLDQLCGDVVWAGPAGRAAADLFAALTANAASGPRGFTTDDLLPTLRQLLGEIAIRPPQGGHPRIAILGLIEARLQQADVVILGGLNEGIWPAASVADPWLSPHVRRELGLADPERRVGLAAHDLATALGAEQVILTRALRDSRSRTIASRFLLRLDAMTGGLARDHDLPMLAETIDANAGRPAPVERPEPSPPAADRPRRISVTQVDRLRADPYAFYASAMLKLKTLDAVDADPGPAWRGSAVHAVLDAWFEHDALDPAKLAKRVHALLAEPGTHPLMRTLWQPRLLEAVQWVARAIEQLGEERRHPIASETSGKMTVAGVALHGVADRIDRLADGTLAIVDYKSGTPPSGKAVKAGYAMQLGLLGAIAQHGGFANIDGKVAEFEYWSLARNKERGFGQRVSPVGKPKQIAKQDFVAEALRQFSKAADDWLTGDRPFTAKLSPEHAPYPDYDQLMRRDEWYGLED